MKKLFITIISLLLVVGVCYSDIIETPEIEEQCAFYVSMKDTNIVTKDGGRLFIVEFENECSDPLEIVDVTIFLKNEGKIVSIVSLTIGPIPPTQYIEKKIIFPNAKLWDDFDFSLFALKYGNWSSI